MPTSEFNFLDKNGFYQLSYLERCVVFDEKLNKVAQHETTHNITKPNKRDFAKQKNIKQNVQFELKSGHYTVGLRLEDSYSKKIAIKKIDVNVK